MIDQVVSENYSEDFLLMIYLLNNYCKSFKEYIRL